MNLLHFSEMVVPYREGLNSDKCHQDWPSLEKRQYRNVGARFRIRGDRALASPGILRATCC
jgi:hypothetical protein